MSGQQESPHGSGLRRSTGLAEAILITIGAVIASGIFVSLSWTAVVIGTGALAAFAGLRHGIRT